MTLQQHHHSVPAADRHDMGTKQQTALIITRHHRVHCSHQNKLIVHCSHQNKLIHVGLQSTLHPSETLNTTNTWY